MIVYDPIWGSRYPTTTERLVIRTRRIFRRLLTRATNRSCSACDASDIKVCVNHA